MSAPLVVNLTDHSVWELRTETRGGQPLYAIAGAPKCCPPCVMATYAELEEHGIADTADVLPVPVGTESQTLSPEQLAEIRASVRGAVRLAPRAWMTLTAALLADYDQLLAERHSTNEALDDAVQALRARPSCPCPPENPPAPHQVGCFFDGVPVSPPSERPVNGLTATFMPVASLRASLEDPHDGPLAHPYRLGHDLPESGGEHRG